MSDVTINDLAEVTTIASGDFVAIWRTANADTRKISRSNLYGGLLTGGGTIATGGFTLTVPATGTAVLGTGTSGRVASFSDANTIAASTLAKSGAGVLTLSAASAYTLTVSGTSTINGSLVGSMTGSGTVATGGFTLTVPATGTAVTLDATQTLTDKTLTTPTIASFTNSTHNHTNAAGGGTLDHGAALTGLTDDDHTQYFLLTGRAAGQSLTGNIAGTASSGYPRVLTINPTFTSNPTNNGSALELKTRLDATVTSAFAQMHLNDVDTASTGSSTSVIGLHISEQTFGTNNTNLYIKSGNGFATAPSGDWAIYSASTRDSWIGGALRKQAGTSSNDAAVGGVLYVTTTQTGNVGTGEDTLASYSIPANTLSANNMSIRFEAMIGYASNANNKQVRVYFGASGTRTVFDTTSLPNNGGGTMITGRILRTGAAAQVGVASQTRSTTVGIATGLNQTLSSAVTFSITGEATSSNDIVLYSLVLYWDDANT